MTRPDGVEDRYRIRNLLGEGGTGRVWLVEDRLRPGVDLALKELAESSRGHEERLRREFATLASLHHPNLVEVHDFTVSPESALPRFTLEFIDGSNLVASVDGEGPSLLLELAAEALRALQFLHDFDLVHRDLKPGNMLVRRAPRLGCRLVLLDFGLSLRGDDSETAATCATGTLPYLAPELFDGAPAGRRSDLYSLGAVLFEAVHGRAPVRLNTDDLAGFILAVKEGKRSRPALPAGYPEGMGGFMDDLLAPDPARRPANATEALSRMNAVCGTRFPLETVTGRISRLRSGPPLERSGEIEQIWSALEPDRDPRIVWLCGEQGCGKTRVLRWMESAALLRGWSSVAPGADLRGWSENLENRLGSLRAMAADKPTILILDEIESAGGPVAALLDRIAREARQPPLQVVAAVSPGRIEHPLLARLFADTGTVPTLRRVDLNRLDAGGVLCMARRAAGGASISERLAERLYSISDGLPATVETMLIEDDWERWGTIPAEKRPASSRAGMLEFLSEVATRWLEAVLILGGDCPETVLLRFCGLEAAEARAAAQEVAAAGLVRLEEGIWIPESRSLAEQLLGAIDPVRSEKLHHRGAVTLTDELASGENRWTLYRLWRGANEPEKAALCAAEAARSSLADGDPAGAAHRFGRALHLLGGRHRLRRALRLELGDALIKAGLYQAAARSFGAALTLSRARKERLQALTSQADALARAGRFGRAYSVTEEALKLSDSIGCTEEGARARKIAGIVLGRMGREEQAIPLLQAALDTVRTGGDAGTEAEIHQALGACRLRLGETGALQDLERAILLYRRAGQKGPELKSLIGLAVLRARDRDHDEAWKILESVRDGAVEIGELGLQEAALSRMAVVATDQGHLDRAMELAEESASLARHLGDRNLMFVDSCRLADARIRCGRPGEATTLLREILEGHLQGVEPENVDYARMQLAQAWMETAGGGSREARALLESALSGCRRRRKRRAWLMALVIEMERRANPGCEDRFEPCMIEFDAVARRSDEPIETEIRLRALLAQAAHHLGEGNPEGARLAAQEACNVAAENDIPAFGAEGHARLGEALKRLQRHREAEKTLRSGLLLLEKAAGKIEDGTVREDFMNRPVFTALRGEGTNGTGSTESRLLALYDMIRALNSETDPDALLESILDMALRVVRAERGMILMKKPTEEDFSVRLARNMESETAEDVESYSSSIVAAAGAGRAVIALDAGNDIRFKDLASVSMYKIRSLMCVPLRSRGTIIGTVYLDSRKEGVLFTRDDLRFLEAFADHAALALENVRRRVELERENRRLQTAAESRVRFGNIVGRSPEMQQVFDLMEKVADTELPVLIHGDSGTGKELVARAIHFNGPRRRKIFLTENCAAIPESLLESELFGHVRGAFTGAERDKPGLFEQADGGTLFMDEIGDMSPGMQARLLRVLQEGDMRRVGGEESIKVDVRVLAATHRNLEDEVKAGRFRVRPHTQRG